MKRKRSRGRGSEAATTGFFVVDSRRGGSWQWARVRKGWGELETFREVVSGRARTFRKVGGR